MCPEEKEVPGHLHMHLGVRQPSLLRAFAQETLPFPLCIPASRDRDFLISQDGPWLPCHDFIGNIV